MTCCVVPFDVVYKVIADRWCKGYCGVGQEETKEEDPVSAHERGKEEERRGISLDAKQEH